MARMTFSANGYRFLEWQERDPKTNTFSPTAYPDAKGWSIGFGTFLGADAEHGPLWDQYRHATIDLETARMLQRVHVQNKVEAPLRAKLRRLLAQHQYDAIVSFDYNTGALVGSTLLKLINAGDIPGAAREFGKWVWYTKPDGTKHKSAALVERRGLEQLMFQGQSVPHYNE